MADHAALLDSDVLSGISGVQSVPRLKGPEHTVSALPPGGLSEDGEMEGEERWLAQVNERIEAERQRRLAREATARQDAGSEESEPGSEQAARLSRLAAAAEAQ